MSTIKRIALASAVSASLLSSVSFAAVPGQMQGAANAQAQAITKAVNVSKATIQCKQATLRIASAAKAKAGKLKGAALRSAIMEATTAAAKKYGIEDRCITPFNVASAASRLTGMYPATGPTMGLAKLGGAGGLAGAAGAAASGAGSALGGIGGLGALAGLVGIAAVAAALDSDDDNIVRNPIANAPATSTGGALSNLTQDLNTDTGAFTLNGNVSGGLTGSGTFEASYTPVAGSPNTFEVVEIIRDASGNIISQNRFTRTFGSALANGAPNLNDVVSTTPVVVVDPAMSAGTT